MVPVKYDSKVLWHSSYQGVGSVSLCVDSGQVVTALTHGIMWLPLGPLYTAHLPTFQRLPLGTPPHCEKLNPLRETTCRYYGLSFSHPVQAPDGCAETNLEAPDIMKKLRDTPTVPESLTHRIGEQKKMVVGLCHVVLVFITKQS